MSWYFAVTAGVALTSFGIGHLAQEPNFDFGLAIPRAAMSQDPTTTTMALGLGGASTVGSPVLFQQGPAPGGQGGGIGGGQGGGFGGGGIGGAQGGLGGGQIIADGDTYDLDHGRIVNMEYHSAKFSQVLAQLEIEGVNFMIKDGDVRDETITINVRNVPMNDALNALAVEMGGRWQRHGQIRIFVKNSSGFDGTVSGSWPPGGFEGTRILPTGTASTAMSARFTNGFSSAARAFSGNGAFIGNRAAFGKGFPGVSQSRQDWKTFVHTMTNSQKQLMKKRGYLKVSDLTERQRVLLGIQKSSFEMAYGSGTETIKIKSD